MIPTTNRLHGLDFLRAVMMSLGVVLHTSQQYMTMPFYDYYWDVARSPSMDALLVFINTFRMPVFYLLSGFFTALLFYKKGLSKMLENRFQRIVIPFVLLLPVLALVMSALRIVALHVMGTGELGFDLTRPEIADEVWFKTHNLWFLYYLMLHVIAVWVVAEVWQRLPKLFTSPMKRVALSSPVYSGVFFVFICLGLAAIGSLSSVGRISAKLSFIPDIKVFSYFGLCFLLGWVLYLRLDDLGELARRWRKYMLVATILLVVALVLFAVKDEFESASHGLRHGLLSLATGFSVGYYMLAFVGLFSQYFQAHNPWIRYFSDSAYWVFVFHSIPLVAIGLLIHDWSLPAEIKFLIVCVGTFLFCLWSYQIFVRNGAMGAVLNGRRYDSVPWKAIEEKHQ